MSNETSFKKDELIKMLKENAQFYPDFPKPGINFLDIFSFTKKPEVFQALLDALADLMVSSTNSKKVDCIIGLDSRGFIFGPFLALKLGVPFVPIRKKGKLPGACVGENYELEYGSDHIEISQNALQKDWNVLIVDDILATGSTAKTAKSLINKVGGHCLGIVVVADLELETETRSQFLRDDILISLIKTSDLL